VNFGAVEGLLYWPAACASSTSAIGKLSWRGQKACWFRRGNPVVTNASVGESA
jgi:hypothetical protein